MLSMALKCSTLSHQVLRLSVPNWVATCLRVGAPESVLSITQMKLWQDLNMLTLRVLKCKGIR